MIIIIKKKKIEEKYIENIKLLFKNTNIKNLLYYFFTIITYGISEILINYTLDNFTIFHILIIFELFNFIYDIFENIKDIKYISLIFFDVLQIILIFIFLEIIELNFWGLNINTKKNILEREKIEQILSQEDEESVLSDEEKDEDICFNENETINQKK